MYGNFFGLRSLPFEDRADTQFFYPTAECQEALAAMEYEIHHGTGLGLLIGEAGTGKTLLLRTILLRLEKSDQPVVVTWPASGEMDLVRECCKGFGVTLPSSPNQSNCLYRLRRHLGRSASLENRSIVIVDQAENLSPGNIAQLATLAELCGERGQLLTVILAAQPLVRALLDRPEFAWIRQQLFGERTLSPLTPKETGEYIRHRLQIAGAVDTRLFDDRAISLIHEISEGIPRLINHVCNAAMLVAYGAKTLRISRTIVEEATLHPAVHERTIAARDLGPAKIGEGGAPWLSVPESLERMVGLAESQATPGRNEPSPQRSSAFGGLGLPFESSVTPADIINYEEADDTWSHANVASGASIVDGEYEGCNGEVFGSGPNKGTFLLSRLERAMDRAERMTSTTDVSLSRLAAVEQRLASLVDQAERLTKTQTQAAQMEQVCGDVRKIFAGLAEATLQAQRQTEELRGIGEDTTTRLAELTAETERAAQTLHEWVEEAVRTQSRLERTLSVCPPIRQTHPTETVRRLSRTVEPFARITSEAAGGELQVLSEPDFDTTPVESRVAKQPTRAEEIAQLISEAKRQEAPTPA
jgi:type II secretory pathway predicted ATPase ExeA